MVVVNKDIISTELFCGSQGNLSSVTQQSCIVDYNLQVMYYSQLYSLSQLIYSEKRKKP